MTNMMNLSNVVIIIISKRNLVCKISLLCIDKNNKNKHLKIKSNKNNNSLNNSKNYFLTPTHSHLMELHR